ncbi:MAG: leucine-rich repeat domain-containing protein, partial [Clostridia bacterium]|nr:leucine-rich repeat domain-containing protein [Clostridia bacterium]
MKKNAKKIFLLLAVVITAVVCFTFSASAGRYEYYTYDKEWSDYDRTYYVTITDVDTSISGDVIIPSTIGGYKVTKIGSEAFWGCKSMTSVTIPDSVTRIASDAFLGCSGIESINIPDGVEYIGNDVFRGCSSLKSITLPDDITYIGDSAFSDCTSLTSINIPDTVTVINEKAFYGCENLKNVYITDLAKWCEIEFPEFT